MPDQVIDMDANTITVSVEDFSPFVLAEAVPEPSTFLLLATAGLGLLLEQVRPQANVRQLRSPERGQ